MKKLENILAENMRRFGTKNLHEAENQSFQLHINRADYDTNISGIVSMTFQGSTPDTKDTFQEIINDIKQDVISKNDPSGRYDQTRLVSDIEFDCDLKVGADRGQPYRTKFDKARNRNCMCRMFYKAFAGKVDIAAHFISKLHRNDYWTCLSMF